MSHLVGQWYLSVPSRYSSHPAAIWRGGAQEKERDGFMEQMSLKTVQCLSLAFLCLATLKVVMVNDAQSNFFCIKMRSVLHETLLFFRVWSSGHAAAVVVGSSRE